MLLKKSREKATGNLRFRCGRWFKRHPEIGIGLTGGIVAAIVLIWCLRATVLGILGTIGRWLLETLVHPLGH